MRNYLVITFLPFFLYACTVYYDADDIRVRKMESREYSSSRIQKVKVKTENGSIQSSVWDDDSIHVTFEKWATGNDREDAEENIDDIKIYVSRDTDSGVLSIDVDLPNRIGTSYGCDVSLNLPSSLFLDLQSSNGAITVSESQNGFECSTSNGAITIEDTEGKAELRTSNGRITVRNHYGELDGKTSNGKINADVVLPNRGECILKTSNGDITLSIPDRTSAMIEASTSSGKVRIEDLAVAIIKMEKTELKGNMGNGEGDIELETSNGDILIKAR